MIRTASVVAEDAPIGVQLWPTVAPTFAPNFTLERVEVVRTCVGTNVRWFYQNGTERVFRLGETVTVDGEALGDWMLSDSIYVDGVNPWSGLPEGQPHN